MPTPNPMITIGKDGFFVAKCFEVGASEAEMAAMAGGVLPETRRRAILEACARAANALRRADPAGKC